LRLRGCRGHMLKVLKDTPLAATIGAFIDGAATPEQSSHSVSAESDESMDGLVGPPLNSPEVEVVGKVVPASTEV
jgi:hypothetical protein